MLASPVQRIHLRSRGVRADNLGSCPRALLTRPVQSASFSTQSQTATNRKCKRIPEKPLLQPYPDPIGFGYWNSAANRKKYLNFLKDQLGGTYESLYKASYDDFNRTGGRSMLSAYPSQSPASAIMTEFAGEYDWQAWRFHKTPRGFWADLGARFAAREPSALGQAAQFLAGLQAKYPSVSNEAWESVANGKVESPLSTKERYQLRFLGGLPAVLTAFADKSSPGTPHQRGQVYSTKPLMAQFWAKPENVFDYLDFLRRQGPNASWENLYSMDAPKFLRTGGERLFNSYNNSTALVCMNLIPDHHWRAWRFPKSPSHWWTDLSVLFSRHDPIAEDLVRSFIDDLAQKHGIKALSSWETFAPYQNMDVTDLRRLQYLGGVHTALAQLHPKDFPQDQPPVLRPWRTKTPPVSFWRDKDNCRQYIDSVKNQLGDTMESLYNLTFSGVIQSGGKRMLSFYKGSPVKAMLALYPNHRWQRWKFARGSPGFWKTVAQQFGEDKEEAMTIVKEYLDEVATENGVVQLEDWYRISRVQLGSTTLDHLAPFGGLPKVLPKVFPNHKWDDSLFRGKAAEQRFLISNVNHLFPTQYALHYRNHRGLIEQIFVKTLTGRAYTIEIKSSETVAELKKKLTAQQPDLTPDAQRLIFSGKQLEDGKKLSEYNIQPEATIHLVERIRGD